MVPFQKEGGSGRPLRDRLRRYILCYVSVFGEKICVGEINCETPQEICQNVEPTKAGSDEDAKQASPAQPQNIGQMKILGDLNRAGENKNCAGKGGRRNVAENFHK